MKEKPFYNIMKPWMDWHRDHANLDSCCEAAKHGISFISYTWEGGRCDQCGTIVVEGKDLPLLKRIKLALLH